MRAKPTASELLEPRFSCVVRPGVAADEPSLSFLAASGVPSALLELGRRPVTVVYIIVKRVARIAHIKLLYATGESSLLTSHELQEEGLYILADMPPGPQQQSSNLCAHA